MRHPSARSANPRAVVFTASLVAGLGLIGCATSPHESKNSVQIDASEYSRVFNSAVLVLRDQGFTIDRQDYRYGTVTTRSVGSPTIVEPWRSGNSSTAQAVNSTLNDQRRRVAVVIEPVGGFPGDGVEAQSVAEDGSYNLRVDVHVERLQVPVRHLTRSTSGRRVFRMLRSNPGELANRGIEGRYWQPIGRDVVLENHLLAAILRKSLFLNSTTAAE